MSTCWQTKTNSKWTTERKKKWNFVFFKFSRFTHTREKKVYNRSLVLVSISKEKTTNYHSNNNSQQSFSSSFIIFLSLVFSHLSSSLFSLFFSLLSSLFSLLFLLTSYVPWHDLKMYLDLVASLFLHQSHHSRIHSRHILWPSYP